MIGPALATDLYEVTMMAGYYAAGMQAPATFELFVRQLPGHRNFLVPAGLEQALDYLEQLHFSAEEIRFLRDTPALQGIDAKFFDEYLPAFRFSGDVWAVDEGRPVFPPSPMLRVTGPLPEAQFVETALLNALSFQTSVASRATRMVTAAAGRPVIEFGARRAHSMEAGVHAARASFLAGCESTSNLEAGRRFGIPVAGTMAHSWVLAFPDEVSAFRQFAETFGPRTVLLLDTYDTLSAARAIVAAGLKPGAVRLDSGDLAELSRGVRGILDAGGLRETTIFVSGDLDEWRIAELVGSGAPVDGFGVGAALSTSSDAPALSAVYKLVELARGGDVVPTMKLSPGKMTYPGRKQVWRTFDHGTASGDLIALADEPVNQPAHPLLRPVMAAGRRTSAQERLRSLRDGAAAHVATLPDAVRGLEPGARYPVRLSDHLQSSGMRQTRTALFT